MRKLLPLVMFFFFVAIATKALAADRDVIIPATPESWATELAEESLRKLENSEHYEKAKLEAKKSQQELENKKKNLLGIMAEMAQKPVSNGEDAPEKEQLPRIIEEYDLFISKSIPLSTLRTYAEAIDRLRREDGIAIRMVMRGFVDGMSYIRPTLDFFNSVVFVNPKDDMFSDPEIFLAVVAIDPDKTVGIEMVPALADKLGKCVIYGDSSLDGLLEKIRNKGCGVTAGNVYEIKERNAIEEIKEAAAKVDTDKVQEKMREQLEAKLNDLPGAGLLPQAKHDETRKVIPEAVLEFDVPDPEHPGEILYPKGFTFNPLEFAPVAMRVFLFAGDRPEEALFVRDWIESSEHLAIAYKITVLGGDLTALNEIMGRGVYSGIRFAEEGWCQATPCLIETTADQTWLDVREFVVQR